MADQPEVDQGNGQQQADNDAARELTSHGLRWISK
jgi:hypothetical protein